MITKQHKRLKLACYTISLSMSVVCNLPPLLFICFRSLYGFSYTQLGLFVFINFFTQLLLDALFALFSHKFNIEKTIKIAPVLTFVGMMIFGTWHFFFPDSVYIGLLLGTIIFSSAAGLCEVLINPVIATIPSDDPDREMSKLHSVYAWGVAPVVVISTLFLRLFSSDLWYWLIFLFACLPVTSICLFSGVKIPEVKTPKKVSGVFKLFCVPTLWLCVFAIFLGGAIECNMAQWASGYLEQAMGISKVWGDIFGVALFSVLLGLGRTLYSKIGKNIFRTLILGAVGSTACYLICAISSNPFIGLVACVLVGFCSSMLWPGCLVIATDKFPKSGVFIYAMMAAGGDFGAAIIPQLTGTVTDIAIAHPAVISMAEKLLLSPEQLGMRIGIFASAICPLLAVIVYACLWKTGRKPVEEGEGNERC